MPCRYDGIEREPSFEETYVSQLKCFLGEIKGEVWEKEWLRLHPLVENQTFSRAEKDNMVAKLCHFCQTHDVTKYSLELQIWWRDHQIEDAKRIKNELDKRKKDKDRAKALAKLTDYEKRLLGIK